MAAFNLEGYNSIVREIDDMHGKVVRKAALRVGLPKSTGVAKPGSPCTYCIGPEQTQEVKDSIDKMLHAAGGVRR